MEIRYSGGVFGANIRPTPFLCLTLKMLQIQPEKDIVVEFIKNEEFKYVRALGAFYLRLTGTAVDCFKYLEPLYNDNRKLRHQNRAGNYEIIHMDEFIDQLLREDRVCDVILPRIQKRHVLEDNNELEPRVSALDDDLEDEGSDNAASDSEPDIYEASNKKPIKKLDIDRRDERKKVDERNERNDRDKHRERDRDRDRGRDRDRDHRRDRDRRDKDRSGDRGYERPRYESRRDDHRRKDYGRDRDRKRHRDDYDDYERRKRRH